MLNRTEVLITILIMIWESNGYVQSWEGEGGKMPRFLGLLQGNRM